MTTKVKKDGMEYTFKCPVCGGDTINEVLLSEQIWEYGTITDDGSGIVDGGDPGYTVSQLAEMSEFRCSFCRELIGSSMEEVIEKVTGEEK